MRGIGIDAEQVSRFEKFAAGERPWRLVYSAREVLHLAAQAQAARAFCAAFCCKEAFYKALGEFYSFPEFECFYLPGVPEQRFVLAPGLRERLGSGRVRVRFDESFLDERGEFVVNVSLIHSSHSYLEMLQVATVEAGRGRIEADDFLPAEVAALGSRRAQSVAGALVLKRALVRLWADAGINTAPRDFELGHHASGAPRLLTAPAGIDPADVFVSISHTRQWAYGLAALGEAPRSGLGVSK